MSLDHIIPDCSQDRSDTEVESDLESASYELVKQQTRKLQAHRPKRATPQRRPSLHRAPQRRASATPLKRNVVIKSTASWSAQPSKRYKTAAPSTPGSWKPATTRPLTPEPSPLLRLRDVDTPCFTQRKQSAAQTPFLSGRKQHPDQTYRDLTSLSRVSTNKSLNRVSTTLPGKLRASTAESEVSHSVVDMVGAMVEEKMTGFLEKFERVLSTNVSNVSSGSRHMSHQSVSRYMPQHKQAAEERCLEEVEMLNTSVGDVQLGGIPRDVQLGGIPRDSALPGGTNRDAVIQTCGEEGGEELGLEETLRNIKLVGTSLPSEPTTPTTDNLDAVSIITHISQTSLLNSFFDVNPDLLPNDSQLETQSVGRNSRDVTHTWTDPRLENTTRSRVPSQHRHSRSVPPATLQKALCVEEGDSGFDNLSTASSAATVDNIWPKVNLSQRFSKMDDTPDKTYTVTPQTSSHLKVKTVLVKNSALSDLGVVVGRGTFYFVKMTLKSIYFDSKSARRCAARQFPHK